MKRLTFLACAAMLAYTASAANTLHEGQGMSGADAYTEMSFNYLGTEAGDHPDLTAKVVYTLTPTADNKLDVTAEFQGLDASKFIGLVDNCYLNINGEVPMTLADGKYTATTSATFEEGKNYTGTFKRMSSAAWYGGDLIFSFNFTYSATAEPQPQERVLYLVGDATSWNVDETFRFTRNGNVYTFDAVGGLSGAWKIWDGTWDYNFGAGAEQPQVNVPYSAWFNASNFSFNTTEAVKLTLCIPAGSDQADSPTPATLLITDANYVSTPDLYIVGAEYGAWGSNDLDSYKMTREGNVYTYVFENGISGEWKIWDGTWDYNFGAGANQPVVGKESDVFFIGDQNFKVNTVGKTTVTFTLVEDSRFPGSDIASKMLIETDGDIVYNPYVILPAGKTDATVIATTYYDWWQAGGIAQTEEAYGDLENATVYTFTAIGDGAASGGWNATDFNFAPVLTGDYDLVFSIRSTSEAKTFVKLAINGKEQETEFTYDHDGEWHTVRMNLKESFPTVLTDNNYGVGEGYVFSFVAGNGLKNGDKFTLTDVCYVGKGADRPGYIVTPAFEIPETLFIIGTLEGNSWGPEVATEMTREGNTFSADVVFASVDKSSYFSFIPVRGDWSTVNSGYRYGAASEDIFNLGEAQTLEAKIGDVPAFNVNFVGNAKVVVDFDAMTVTVTENIEDVAIDTIDSDTNAPAVYYNLNGIRVDNPSNGIFIRRQGNTVTKVLVK